MPIFHLVLSKIHFGIHLSVVGWAYGEDNPILVSKQVLVQLVIRFHCNALLRLFCCITPCADGGVYD